MGMVTDPNTAGPVRINSHMGAEGGRGLQVVESCSVRWGWRPLDRPLGEDGPAKPGPARSAGSGGAGKVVWALLQLQNLRRIAGGWRNGRAPHRCVRAHPPPRATGTPPGRLTPPPQW